MSGLVMAATGEIRLGVFCSLDEADPEREYLAVYDVESQACVMAPLRRGDRSRPVFINDNAPKIQKESRMVVRRTLPVKEPKYIILTDSEALQRAGITTPIRTLRRIYYDGFDTDILVKRHGRMYVDVAQYHRYMERDDRPKTRKRRKAVEQAPESV